MHRIRNKTIRTYVARDVYDIAKELADRYHDFSHYNKKNPLAEALFIICSIQTDLNGYHATYRALRRTYPTFSALARASQKDIERTIFRGGLSKQKSESMTRFMTDLILRFGKPTLSPLKKMQDAECEQTLLSLPGIGKKTARCIMMYSLGRAVFPVDTHCWRISRRIGWVRATRSDGYCSPRDMDRLQAKIPPELRFSLHVNMVSLGREVCLPKKPHCINCPIKPYCRRIGLRSR